MDMQTNLPIKVHTQSTFMKEIEKIVREQKVTYLEAMCDYIKANNIEPETVPKLLGTRLKQIIESEATDLNLINRGKKRAKFKV
jgi:hypothetical protein